MSIKSNYKENIKIYESIENAIKSNDNFIYIKKDISPIRVFPFNNFFGIICDIGDNTPIKSGIPNELLMRTDMSINIPKITKVNDDSIAYFSADGYDTKEQVIEIIKLFNMLSSTNISIYTTNEIYNYVKGFYNENITFYCYDNIEEISISANTIITYGYCARKFIQKKIPTIIIGPYGLGGWVTPENMSYFIKDNFKGRVGGNLNEIIPLEILVDELLEIKENRDIDKLLNKNSEILETYLSSLNSNEIEIGIKRFNNIHSMLNDKTECNLLKPKLSSNVFIRKIDKTTFIQRKIINDTMFSLPDDELEFLKDLKSDITCEKLQEKYELNSKEFWDIIQPLWERKAIIFNYDL